MLNNAYRRSFSGAQRKARRLSRNPMGALGLVAQAARKAGSRRGFVRDLWDDFTALLRFVRAWGKGDYRQVPQRSVLFALAALIYFVSPIDAIFDFIPVLGLVDDATVIAFVLNAIRTDLDDFREWELTGGGQAPVIDAETSSAGA